MLFDFVGFKVIISVKDVLSIIKKKHKNKILKYELTGEIKKRYFRNIIYIYIIIFPFAEITDSILINNELSE